jgi:epoxyqueuosine reductase
LDKKTALTQELRKRVLSAGIDLIGITSTKPFKIQGEEERRIDPKEILKDAQSVIVLGFCVYKTLDILPSEPGKPRGRFSSYGNGVYLPMRNHCRKVIQQLLQENGFKSVPAAQVPAKIAAVRAGLAKYGKNAVVLTKELGSWVMFECLVSDAPLDYEDHPVEVSDCRECNICLDACPTKAIYAPFKLDRARCITNWLWGAFVPTNLREKQEARLFGCAECLKACPKNKHLKPRIEYPVPLEKVSDSPELIPLATGNSEYYRDVISAFPRAAGIEAIRGNVIIALGNIADPSAVSALEETLQYPKPQVRAYSAWALGRIASKKARKILEEASLRERNPKVIREIKDALG